MRGSGITETVTLDAVPALFPKSTAVAPKVRLMAVTGTLSVNWYGGAVVVNTGCPFTVRVTEATAISSVAFAAKVTVWP